MEEVMVEKMVDEGFNELELLWDKIPSREEFLKKEMKLTESCF